MNLEVLIDFTLTFFLSQKSVRILFIMMESNNGICFLIVYIHNLLYRVLNFILKIIFLNYKGIMFYNFIVQFVYYYFMTDRIL